jgi:L-amino acid N-acyltransferase YncA
MEYRISPLTNDDREKVIDIFNYYIENSFAAFPDDPVPYQAYEMIMKMSAGLPAVSIKNKEGILLGFGMLKRFNPFPAFSRTAEVAYFIAPDNTGQGLGKLILDHLEEEGKKLGVTTLLAHISSLNIGSINFHKKNGFSESGRFVQAGVKNDQVFDSVWMQKML